MRRRGYLLVTATVGVGGIAGCTGTDSRSGEAGEHIETAVEHLDTAGNEFSLASGRLWDIYDTLDYSSETVQYALSEARSELDAAADAEPSTEQEVSIASLRDLANAIEQTAVGYGALIDMYDHLDIVQSYTDARRREDAFDELTAVEEDRVAAADALDAGLEALHRYEPIEDDLDEELATIEWEQRLGQARGVVETLGYLFDGYEYELHARFTYQNATDSMEEGDYDSASESFNDAWESFEQARVLYRDGEDIADTDLQQTLIEYSCRMENRRDASEFAQIAAMEYESGDTNVGDEELERAREALDRSC